MEIEKIKVDDSLDQVIPEFAHHEQVSAKGDTPFKHRFYKTLYFQLLAVSFECSEVVCSLPI